MSCWLVGHRWGEQAPLVAAAEQFAELVAYRSLDRVFILDAAQLPGGSPRIGHCLGWTGAATHHLLRDAIGDRWPSDPNTTAAAIVIDTERIEATYTTERARLVMFGAVVVHELAHVFEHVTESPVEALVGFRKHEPGQLDWLAKGMVYGIAAATLEPSAAPPWQKHELRFVRSYLHTAQRAARLGFSLDDTEHVAAGWHYGLAPLSAYRAAFADELEQRGRDPVHEILASDPPGEALTLFASDTEGQGDGT